MNRRENHSIKHALSIVTLMLLAACSGGGGAAGSNNAGANTPGTMSGAVMDGLISGAMVCLDLNSNGICDANELTATTGSNGSYAFTYPSGTNLTNLNVIAQIPVGAIDSDHPGTPVTTAFQMLAPATQPLAVTPLTTLVSEYVLANSGMSAQNAAAAIITALGLPQATNLFEDYTTTNNTALHNIAQLVNTVLLNANLGNSPSMSSLTSLLRIAAVYVPAAISPTANMSSILSTAKVSAETIYGNLISTVPTATYTTDNLTIYSQINTIRQNAGVGLLFQNSYLDTAAASHASYLITNNLLNNTYLNTSYSGTLGAHYETATATTGFTGGTPLTRATAAGYVSSNVSELLSVGAASGAACIASIEDSVYHLIDLLLPYVNVGVSFDAGTGSGAVCGIELGISTGSGQYPAAGNIGFYPGNGQMGVPPSYYLAETPAVPDPSLTAAGVAGHPIVISLYNQANTSLLGTDVVLNTFTLNDSSNTPVATEVFAQAGVTGTFTADSNIPAPGVLVLLPTARLSANATYTVTFAATVKGAAVNKRWSFTTGNLN
jgi:uncharacterized protein YkwD